MVEPPPGEPAVATVEASEAETADSEDEAVNPGIFRRRLRS